MIMQMNIYVIVFSNLWVYRNEYNLDLINILILIK